MSQVALIAQASRHSLPGPRVVVAQASRNLIEHAVTVRLLRNFRWEARHSRRSANCRVISQAVPLSQASKLQGVEPHHQPIYHDIMAKTLVGALALAALPSALAFRNTSPFFLFSTAEYALWERVIIYLG